MPAESLLEIARRACGRYIRNITDVGECPYDLIRSVLLKVENPDQLHQIEQNSPQIIGKTKELWVNIIKRDIPNWESKIIYPNNPDNWWKVYRKLKRDMKRDNEASEALLKARLSGIRNERESQLATLTDKKPQERASWTARSTYAYKSGRTGSRAPAPKNFFDKIKRDAVTKSSARMATPTHKLNLHSSKVLKAPMAMVEELKARKPSVTTPLSSSTARETRTGSTTRPAQRSQEPRAVYGSYDMTHDREERLRKLKNGNLSNSTTETSDRKANTLSEDFLEDDEDEDDLFSNEPMNSPQKMKDTAQSWQGRGPQPKPPRRRDPGGLFHTPGRR